MIIYQNEKYACVSCIRGHRSSSCKHTARMLVKVRTRGRPNSCNMRKVIMVDKDSQVNKENGADSDSVLNGTEILRKTSSKDGKNDENYEPGIDEELGSSCSGMEVQPILFMNVKKKQNALLVDGKLKIIVDEGEGAGAGAKRKSVANSKDLQAVDTPKPDRNSDSVKYLSEIEFIKQYVKEPNNGKENLKQNFTPRRCNDSSKLHLNLCGCNGKARAMKSYQQAKAEKKNHSNVSTTSSHLPMEFYVDSNGHISNSTVTDMLSPKMVDSLPQSDEISLNNFHPFDITSGESLSRAGSSIISNLYGNEPNDMDKDIDKKINSLMETTDSEKSDSKNIVVMEEILKDSDLMVELLTHKGLYLSSTCSCPDDNCPCSNCLIHRNESELNAYIQQSGIPLTELGEARVLNSMVEDCSLSNCKCTPENCECVRCTIHGAEIVSFDKIICFGITNYPFRRKSQIRFKNKLIPSSYWWDFIKEQLPLLTQEQLEATDILSWFDDLITIYGGSFQDAELAPNQTNMLGIGYL